MQTISITATDQKMEVLKGVMKVLAIKYTESPYNSAYVKKIKTSEKRGNYKKLNLENLWEDLK